MYQIIHCYDVDGGFGDAISKSETLGFVATEEEAKAYVEKYSKPRIYDKPYSYLWEHELRYEKCNMLDTSTSPWGDDFIPEMEMKDMLYTGNRQTEILNLFSFGEGYKGLVINTRGQFPCGYVQFPEINKLESYDDIYVDADVHGGFTFLGTFEHLGLKGKWLGWDYSHCGDYCCYGIPELDNIGSEDEYRYTTSDVTMDVEEVLDAIKKGRYEIERSEENEN